MSEDPTRPVPSGDDQQNYQQRPSGYRQGPTFRPNEPAYQQPQPRFTPNPDYQPDPGPPPPPSRQPGDYGYQPDPPAYQPPPPYQPPPAYQGPPAYQEPGEPPWQQNPPTQVYQEQMPRVRVKRRRWPLRTGIALVVLLILLVGGDRVANALAENAMATQFQNSIGLSKKPSVTIQGFPFLTQLAAGDFHQVNISATNETTGQVQIASLNAVLDGLHPHGTSSATIDKLNATALISFAQLANIGGVPADVTLQPGADNTINATVSAFGLSTSATAQVTRTSANTINVKVTNADGIPTDLLGNLTNFNITLPKLPAGVTITSFSITQQGLQVSIAGQNVNLSQ
jgi:hypothetical protein